MTATVRKNPKPISLMLKTAVWPLLLSLSSSCPVPLIRDQITVKPTEFLSRTRKTYVFEPIFALDRLLKNGTSFPHSVILHTTKLVYLKRFGVLWEISPNYGDPTYLCMLTFASISFIDRSVDGAIAFNIHVGEISSSCCLHWISSSTIGFRSKE